MPLVPQKTRGPKFKKRVPKRFFLFQCFSAGAQRTQGAQKTPPNLKIEALKSGAPNSFFVPCFSAGSKQRGTPKSTGLQRVQGPKESRAQKRSPKIKLKKKRVAPNFKMRGSKSRVANKFFLLLLLARDSKKRGQKLIGVTKFQNL